MNIHRIVVERVMSDGMAILTVVAVDDKGKKHRLPSIEGDGGASWAYALEEARREAMRNFGIIA